MSYILEALKKADQERSRGGVPDISAAHADVMPARDGRRPGLWLIAGLLLVNLLALYLYQRSSEPDSHPQPLPAVESPPMATAPESVTPAVMPPAKVEPEPAPYAETRIVLPPPTPASSPAPSSEPVSPSAPQVTTAAMEPIEEDQVLSVPTWQRSSAAIQQLAAGLSLDVHVYADQPAQRFVLINMSKYREGDELREGALLERITAQGVVLSYRGERFRYDKP